MRFERWEDAQAFAQKRANESGLSCGIERMKEYGRDGFNVRFIPGPKYRFGCDARCEVVDPIISIKADRGVSRRVKAAVLGLLAVGQLALVGTVLVIAILLASALAGAINRVSKGRL